MHYKSYAETIQEDEYFINIVAASGKAVEKAVDRDKTGCVEVVGSMSGAMINNSMKTYNAVDVALETAELLSTGQMSVKTNITILDQAMGGLGRGTLTLIAARPSMGKTTFAGTIARSMAQAGSKILFFSLEEKRQILWSKWTAGACGLEYRKVQDREISDWDQDRYDKKSAELMNLYEDRLLFFDDPKIDSSIIYSIVCRERPDAFIVDHSRIVKDKNEREVKRMGEIIQNGKEIAKIFDCAAIYLQQLNRGVEGRDDKRPTMGDLRDSGELEENSDNVLFLYRDDYYNLDNGNKRISKTELIPAKFRSGKRNIRIWLDYVPSEFWFYSPGETK
jgi:replicative DNA helicase